MGGSAFFRQAATGAAFALAATVASAATVAFNLDYLATNIASNGTGDFATLSGGTAVKVGTITLTDLADLHLGDGKTGVRSTISLTGLNQFSSGAGSIFISSYELNFKGTSTGGAGGGELSATAGVNWRQVGGLNVTGIEFGENGATNGWGAKTGDPSFEQEINFATGSFTNGLSSTIDFLNGGSNGFNGFSVASLLSNAVANTNSALPDAYAWIKIRSSGGGISTIDNGNWWEPAVFNAAGGRLDVISVQAVPEPETYAMMGLGLLMVAGLARRSARSRA
jgi:hypothetical protein